MQKVYSKKASITVFLTLLLLLSASFFFALLETARLKGLGTKADIVSDAALESVFAEYQKEMPEFVFRTRVKAGVTGFAQIYGKYNTVPYDKLKLDLFYIENYSLWMDLKLILMTVKTVLKKDSTEGVDTDQTTGLKEHTEGNEEVERKIQEYTSREESHHE